MRLAHRHVLTRFLGLLQISQALPVIVPLAVGQFEFCIRWELVDGFTELGLELLVPRNTRIYVL